MIGCNPAVELLIARSLLIMAALMNQKEASDPGRCEKNIDTIVGWLRNEATKRQLPFFNFAGKMLVKRAIRNHKKNA